MINKIVSFFAKSIVAAGIGLFALINITGTPLEAIHNIADYKLISNEEIQDIKDSSYSSGYEAGKKSARSESSITSISTTSDSYVNSSYTTDTRATVYVTEYGECYHIDPNCSSLRRSNNIFETNVNDASRAHRPCKLCMPYEYDY